MPTLADAIIEYPADPEPRTNSEVSHYATLRFLGASTRVIEVHRVMTGHGKPYWQLRGYLRRSVWMKGEYEETVNALLAEYFGGEAA